jgi:hypothetical protein
MKHSKPRNPHNAAPSVEWDYAWDLRGRILDLPRHYLAALPNLAGRRPREVYLAQLEIGAAR